jgi:hypothetical protein
VVIELRGISRPGLHRPDHHRLLHHESDNRTDIRQ